MRPRVTIGSLFAGIGGLELGLESALREGGFDVSTIWQCEQDAWCRGILARHWPDALRYDDVRTLGEHNAPRVTTERRERRPRLKALGNAVVPQVGHVIGCVVADLLRRGIA